MTPAKAFGRVLRIRRRAASLTQETLGFEAELTRVYMSGLERGMKQPTITTVLRLAAGLGCSAAELMADTEAQLKAADPLGIRADWPRRTGRGIK